MLIGLMSPDVRTASFTAVMGAFLARQKLKRMGFVLGQKGRTDHVTNLQHERDVPNLRGLREGSQHPGDIQVQAAGQG